MERADDEHAWAAMLPGGSNLWNDISTELIERLFAGQALLRRSERRPVSLHIPPESLLVRALNGSKETSGSLHLGLPPQLLVGSLELSTTEWEELEAVRAGRSLRRVPDSLLEKVARAGLIDDG
jgi:hypothetical protein